MKKSTIALAVLGALSAVPAVASDWTVTGNVNVLTDYRFRGISQTGRGPALQGGFDAAHKSGFYIGNWNSNVSAGQFPGGAGIEMDFYAGYKGDLGKTGLSYDVGNLYYYYDQARYGGLGSASKTNNNEVYVGLGYGAVSGKYSYATTDYFGLNDTAVADFAIVTNSGAGQGRSRGTSYTELNYSAEVMPKVTLSAHVGYTDIKNYKEFSYTDYRVGLSYDMKGIALAATYVGTDVKGTIAQDFYTNFGSGTGLKQLYKDTIVLSIGKTF